MTLNFEGPVRGTRRLVASSCEEVAQAAKLLLRLGSRGALPADPALTPPPLTETETQTALEAVPASSATPEITPWGLAGLIGAALDVGTLPAPSGRLALAVEGHRRAVALILEARIGFPSRFEVNGGSLTVERPLEGQLVGCWAPTLRAFAVGPCAAVSLGWWNLRGSGVSSPKSATVAFAAASAQARASLQAVGGLIISVMAGLRFNLVRLAPFYTDSGTLFTAPLMAGDFQVAAGWRW